MPPPIDRPQEHLGELLAGADDQAADDGARHRGEAAQDQHRQRLQRQQRQRELHAELAAPHRARRQRHQARDQPDDEPDLVERNADRLGGGMVVGHGAQRAADARPLEEQRQPGDQQAGDHGGPDVELVHQDAAVEQRSRG